MVKNVVNLQECRGRHTITLPKNIISSLGWKKGDVIGERTEKQMVILGETGEQATIQNNDRVYSVSIITQIIKKVGWHKGDLIGLSIDDKQLFCRRIKL